MRLKAKRFPQGSSSGRGSHLRLTLLLATVAAFLLVPAAQAFANATMQQVNMAGNGKGEVNSGALGPLSGYSEVKGNPPIECTYESPGPAAGQCNNEFLPTAFGDERMVLRAKPLAGYEFAGWTVEKGTDATEGEEGGTCANGAQTAKEKAFEEFEVVEPGERVCLIKPDVQGTGEAEVTATFNKEGNPLTLEKITTNGGEGTVVSNPVGINCGPSCSKETASFEKEKVVTLTASPASGSVFTSWTGCVKTIEGTGAKGHTCTVQMTKALTVKAKFTKVQAISGAKDPEGNGFGTITSAPGGISCGPACSSATAVFTEGSTVTVKAAPVASTSVFAGWTSCPGTEEGASCKVVASEAKTATAKFNLIQQFALTLTKSGGGTGTVSSAPAGISCGPTCSSAVGSYNSGKEVTLKEVAASGSTFGGWSGACSGTGECKVTMSGAKSVEAEFK